MKVNNLIWLVLFSASVDAAELAVQDDALPVVRLSGFATLGFATSDDNQKMLVRDQQDRQGIQKDTNPFVADSRMGIQADANFTPTVSATVQMVFKARPQQSLNESLQWAFVKWQAQPELQLRAGRLGVDSFMLSDQRNVGLTYLWARPPVEFYGTLPFYHYNGGDARYTWTLDNGEVSAKLLAGTATATLPTANSVDSYAASPIIGGSLAYQNETFQTRVSAMQGKITSSLAALTALQSALAGAGALGYADAARLQSALNITNTKIRFLSAGFLYEPDAWQLQGEVSNTLLESKIIPDTYGAYLTVGRHFGKWTPYLSYARAWQNENVVRAAPAPAALQPFIQPLINATNAVLGSDKIDQHTVSIGTRWDFSNSMALKLQYDRVDVRNAGYGLWFGNFSQPNSTTNITSLILDGTF